MRKPQSAAEAFEERIEKQMAEGQDLNENAVRKEEKARLHEDIDEHLKAREHRMAFAAHQRNTNQLWDLITAAVESGFVKYFKLEGQDAKKIRGRSNVRIFKEEGKTKTGRDSKQDEQDNDEQ